MAISILKEHTNILRLTFVGLTVLLLWGEVRQAEAGCQRFGHSCFGAHGKRAEIPSAAAAASGLELEGIGNYNSRPVEYESLPTNYNNRISPYLIDWIMSMRRGEPRESPQLQREDIEVRRK